MINRIAIVGGNGSGKTTLGAALSKELNCKHMDIENYYFEDAEMQPMPKMFDKTSWAEMQKAIIEKVKLLQ